MARMKELEAREEDQGRDRCGGARKTGLRPSCRREMAIRAVSSRGVSIRPACEAFGRPTAENDEIANWLLRLTDNHRN
jgi:putative transposase